METEKEFAEKYKPYVVSKDTLVKHFADNPQLDKEKAETVYFINGAIKLLELCLSTKREPKININCRSFVDARNYAKLFKDCGYHTGNYDTILTISTEPFAEEQ